MCLLLPSLYLPIAITIDITSLKSYHLYLERTIAFECLFDKSKLFASKISESIMNILKITNDHPCRTIYWLYYVGIQPVLIL